jgi:hypothetical protein
VTFTRTNVVAMVTESQFVLAVFIASIVGLCLAAMYVHSTRGCTAA